MRLKMTTWLYPLDKQIPVFILAENDARTGTLLVKYEAWASELGYSLPLLTFREGTGFFLLHFTCVDFGSFLIFYIANPPFGCLNSTILGALQGCVNGSKMI